MKQSIDVFLMYCDCMMEKMSLRACAACCGISLDTAFKWRHKILDALQNTHNEVLLNVIIESDETYFALCFKGSKRGLPRKAHHRGSECRTRGISGEQVCISCSVNHNGLSIGRITNLGRPSTDDLSSFMNGRIESGGILVTDGLVSYETIAEINDLTHITIPSGKHKNGLFNIQTINSYHRN